LVSYPLCLVTDLFGESVMAAPHRRSHVTFDDGLGEFPTWSQFTKNTFIEFDDMEDEKRSSARREKSAPACALKDRTALREHLWGSEASTQSGAERQTSRWTVGQSRERSSGRSSRKSSTSSRWSSCCSKGRSSGRSSGPHSRRNSRCRRNQSYHKGSAPSSRQSSRRGNPCQKKCPSRQSSKPVAAQHCGVKWEDNAAEEVCEQQRRADCAKVHHGACDDDSAVTAVQKSDTMPPTRSAYHVKIANRYDILEQEMPDDDDMMGKEAMEVELAGEFEGVHPSAASSGQAPPRSSGKASRGKRNQRARKVGGGSHNHDGIGKEKGPAAIESLQQLTETVQEDLHKPEEDRGSGTFQSNAAKVERTLLKRRQVAESASSAGASDLPSSTPCDGALAGMPSDGNVAKQEMNSNAPQSTVAEAQGMAEAGAALTNSQMTILALLAVRLNEYSISCHMKAVSQRQMVVATPVEPCPTHGPDILKLESGDVVQCEAVDSSGLAIGCVIAPARLAGQRGCFQCQGMWPVNVELQKLREGDVLRSVSGNWSDVNRLCAPTTHQRLRQKALYNRMRVARESCNTGQVRS